MKKRWILQIISLNIGKEKMALDPLLLILLLAQRYWEVIRSQALIGPIIYNAGIWKLRQITGGYDFTKFIPENFPVTSVKLSVVANNVLMLKKWVPNIDPDSFGYTSDNIVGLESSVVPTTRGLGFNLNVFFKNLSDE
jgi:hypothetical protein